MQGSAYALLTFFCLASSDFWGTIRICPRIPWNSPSCSSLWPKYYFLVPIGALLHTFILIYLRVSAYNNHWWRLCKMLVYLNIQNLLPEKQKEWIMNLRLEVHKSELWHHMISISNYSCLMLKSMYLLDL